MLGQQVIVEPRPGAGGVIAAQSVANAPPDGYLLLQATASYTINTALQSSAYDMRKDFAPVTLVSTIPFVLVVHPSVPAKTLSELIAYAKANPGKLNYASSGIGTPPHLAGELFKTMAGIDIVHVPFREANSALNAVISGATQMSFVIASIAQSQMSGGTVRGLAVTSRQASPLVPGVRPVARGGAARLRGDRLERVRGAEGHAGAGDRQAQRARSWPGSTIPSCASGSPPRATSRPRRTTPDQFAAFIAADTTKWLDLVAKTNMKAN